jgi:hypothetical protein
VTADLEMMERASPKALDWARFAGAVGAGWLWTSCGSVRILRIDRIRFSGEKRTGRKYRFWDRLPEPADRTNGSTGEDVYRVPAARGGVTI